MQLGNVEQLNLFGRPTYTKNQAINQKNLENFAEKISMLDTLQSCEKTVYRLVPNLPSSQTGITSGIESNGSASSPTPNTNCKYDSFNQAMMPQSRGGTAKSSGFRVVKPFGLTQSGFNPTASSLSGFGGYDEHNSPNRKIPRKQSPQSRCMDRNFIPSNRSTLSKQYNGEAQMFYRELKVALNKD